MNQKIFEQLPYIQSNNAQDLYYDLLNLILKGDLVSPVLDEKSVGSFFGSKERPTRELRYVTFILTNPRNRWMNVSTFCENKILPRALFTTLSDEISLDAIAFYDSGSKKFSEDQKVFSTSYGYRARHYDNVNQIQDVIQQLRKDPSSRRAVIHIHAVGDGDKKYSPCIDSLHFFIRNQALECHTIWRSENVFRLLPTNIFEFTMLQELIASELELPLGPYAHTVSSLHYYLDDELNLIQTIKELAEAPLPSTMDPMPFYSLEELERLKALEQKLRLTDCCLEEMEEFINFPTYWKEIASKIADTIQNKKTRIQD